MTRYEKGTYVNEKGALEIKESLHYLKENGHRSDFKEALIGSEGGTYVM